MVFLLFALSRQHRAQAETDGKQAGRLAIGQLEINVFGNVDPSLPGQLQQFALDHGLGQGNQEVQDLEIALRQGNVKGLHVKPIAGQHTQVVAPAGIGGEAPAAGVRFVNHVVVNERGGVDELHHRAQPNRRLPLEAAQFGGEQHQRGTQPFAPASSQVLTDLGDGLNAGDALQAKLLLHLLEVSAHQVEDFFDGQAIDGGQVLVPHRPFSSETPTQVLQGTAELGLQN